MSLARVVVVMTACLTAGCFRHSGDAPDFPTPLSETTCPDLSGSFAMQADAGSQVDWSNTAYTHTLGGPATVLSLFDSGGSAMTTVFHRDPAEFAAAIERFRKERPAEYAAWRKQALTLFDPMRGVLKVRRELPFDTLRQLGPVPEWGMHGRKGECRDGWWVEQGDYDTEIAMTRDVRGGLQVRFDKTERKVISLWAETGAGIPYSIHTHSRWARFVPAEVPSFWTPTVQNLPLDERAQTAPDPDGWLQKDEDPRIVDLRIRARKLMGADAQLLNFRRESDYVLFTGTLPDRAALDVLLASLKAQPEVAGATLESTMNMNFGRVRFVIHLNLKR
ncbi:MAG: hypothetical protein IPO95_05370 [Rhodanobacteraceae bacterium]|nr:hypothetical protein [Rhodanobacteraceae bacterium]